MLSLTVSSSKKQFFSPFFHLTVKGYESPKKKSFFFVCTRGNGLYWLKLLSHTDVGIYEQLRCDLFHIYMPKILYLVRYDFVGYRNLFVVLIKLEISDF